MNTLKSLADIFERRIFRIPDYQRGYSWENEQLEDFWEDINRLNTSQKHYTGLITLQKVDVQNSLDKWENEKWLIEDDEVSPFYIVDGQQRLTTMIILLQEILNLTKSKQAIASSKRDSIIEKYIKRELNSNKSYFFGYEFNDPSDYFLKAKVFCDDEIVFNQPMTIYTRNLENAQSFFKGKLEGKTFGELENIFRKITIKLIFNVYEIQTDLEVFVTFETTNNRGKSLSRLELLKNRLIYLTTLFQPGDLDNKKYFENEQNQLRRKINEAWKNIYEFLGKNKDNPLNDDDFLKNHFFMYFGYDTKESKKFGNILLNQIFTSKAIQDGKLTLLDLKDYVESINISVTKWFLLKNPEHSYTQEALNNAKDVAIWLSKLNRLSFSPFNPCIMATMVKGYEDKPIFLSLLKSMERYVFLMFKISKRKNGTGKNKFYNRAKTIYKAHDSSVVYDLCREIEDLTQDPNQGHDPTMERFKIRVVEELFKSSDISKAGFYGWSGLKYFLYEYELSLQGDRDNKVSWDSFNRTDTIEHIYPQKPDDEYWRTRFNRSENECNLLLNNLGNLLLLSRKQNSRSKNYGFDKKRRFSRDGKPESGYFNGSYSEIEVSKESDWNEKSILTRGIKMLTFMEKRWDLKFKNREHMVETLLLGFIEQ